MSRIHPTQKEIYFDEVISLRFHENLTIREISKKTGVCKSVIHRWISIFASDNPEKLTDMKKRNLKSRRDAVKPAARRDTGDVVSKDAEIAELKEKLRMANMRADAFNELINVAEKQFNINIRKKAGAKQ